MKNNQTLFVRIAPKNGPAQFFRCGVSFGRQWTRVDDVDAATAERLHSEQMLEVVADQPADYEVAEVPVESSEAGKADKGGKPAPSSNKGK